MQKSKGHIKSTFFKKYLSNTMDVQEKSDFEKELNEDAFEMEALEGFESLGDNKQALEAIEAIEAKIGEKTGITKERAFQFVYWKQLGIAASFLLLIGAAFGIKEQLKNNEQVALNTPNELRNQEVTNAEMLSDSNSWLSFDDSSFQVPNEPNSSLVMQELEEEISDVKVVNSQEDLSTKYKEKNLNQDYIPVQNDGISSNAVEEFEEVTTRTIANEGSFKKEPASNVLKPASVAASSPSVDAEISTSTTQVKLDFEDGKDSYAGGDYVEAITHFESALNRGENIVESEFYIGMSNYNLAKTNKALKSFDKVIASNSPLKANALWYKSLILLDNGEEAAAKKILKDLANGSSSFKNQAIDKLKSMD